MRSHTIRNIKSRKSHKSRKSRKVKTKKMRRINKIIYGGNSETVLYVDLRQILISVPIINAVKEYDQCADISDYKKTKEPQGYCLSRMDNMLSLNYEKLLEEEPIQLKAAKNLSGKTMGIKIDNKIVPLYEIINGRHRVARAIIEKREKIPAIIVNEN